MQTSTQPKGIKKTFSQGTTRIIWHPTGRISVLIYVSIGIVPCLLIPVIRETIWPLLVLRIRETSWPLLVLSLVVSLYFLCVYFINATIFEVKDASLTVKNQPLPWFGAFSVHKSQIHLIDASQVWDTNDEHWGEDSKWSPKYSATGHFTIRILKRQQRTCH